MVEFVDTIVVGAGVAGLAVARGLALAGREVIVLEAAEAIGTEVSSRNSEVIHAGIYYPKGSLKARLCVAGRDALYAYCAAHGIPHARTGKLIVATAPEEVPALRTIEQAARANGVMDLAWLDRAAVLDLEPALDCAAALLSPSTGIVDGHAFMLALQGEAEAHGALVVFRTPVLGGSIGEGGHLVHTGGAEPMTLRCRALVNCAGLDAQRVAMSLRGLPRDTVPTGYLAKGSYFFLSGQNPFRRLVYPVPVGGSLGIHVALDLAGQARFGPDIEWVSGRNYDVDPARAPLFYRAIRRYWPGLPDGRLQPAYAGIRPKLHPPDAGFADFVIQGPEDHGTPGLVNLFGIESPGLTAALAIADHVAGLISAGHGAH